MQASPGPGKTFEAFQADLSACKQFASTQVAGQAEAANQAAGAATFTAMMTGGTPDQAAVGGSQQGAIQQEYDNAYAQCMYLHGELVAGYSPPPTEAVAVGSVPRSDPLVRSVQRELMRLGYLRGPADGVMGPRTGSAIRSFESANGLAISTAASPQLLARLQATPAGEGGNNVASAAAAPSTSHWVAPVSGGNAAPGGASGPTAPGGWVSPVKTP